MSVRHNEAAYAYFVGQAVKGVALYNLASCAGEEAFALAFKVAEHYVAHDGVEDCVAEELEPLVVDEPPLGVALVGAAVQQRLLVDVDVVGIKSEYCVQRRIKLLFLAERELHAVNKVVNLHIS